MLNDQIYRGDVWLADLGVGVGSEQNGLRPVVVCSNQKSNDYSPIVTIAAITGKLDKAKLPTHVLIEAGQCGIERTSVVLGEQVRTISKTRLIQKVAELDEYMMRKVDRAVGIQMGLIPIQTRPSNPVHNNKPVLV